MKRAGIILLSILGIAAVIFFNATDPVNTTPFYNSGYYKTTGERLDSLKKEVVFSTDSLYSGFSKESITPSLNNSQEDFETGKFKNVPLAGYGNRKGKASAGIHDSLFIKSLALRSGDKTVVFISGDMLIMPPNITDKVAELLEKEGILRQQLFFSATHSHSSVGAWGAGLLASQFAGDYNPNIEKWLVLKIVKAIKNSMADLSPSVIGYGQFPAAGFTRNRLTGEKGTKNDDFNYLVVQQTGKRKAIVGSFSAHSTTLGDENMLFSADYPGYWQREMEKHCDLALFFAGSVGSQSPVAKGDGFDKSKYLGEALADSLLKVAPQVQTSSNPVFSYISLKTDLPSFGIRLIGKRPFEPWVSKMMMPYPDHVYLQAVRIGNLIWITTPCDFSGEFALQIKNTLDSHGFESFVTSFNGSYIGYVIPGKYFYLDEYEPKTMGWFGPTTGDYFMELIRHLYQSLIR